MFLLQSLLCIEIQILITVITEFFISYTANDSASISIEPSSKANSSSIEPLLCQVKDPFFCSYCASIEPLLSLVVKQIQLLLSLYCAK